MYPAMNNKFSKVLRFTGFRLSVGKTFVVLTLSRLKVLKKAIA